MWEKFGVFTFCCATININEQFRCLWCLFLPIFSSPPKLFVAKQVVIKWGEKNQPPVGVIATKGIMLSRMLSELGVSKCARLKSHPGEGSGALATTARQPPPQRRSSSPFSGLESETSRRENAAQSVTAYRSWRPLRSRAAPPGYCRPHGRCCRRWGRRRRWRSAGSPMFLHKGGVQQVWRLFLKTLLNLISYFKE